MAGRELLRTGCWAESLSAVNRGESDISAAKVAAGSLAGLLKRVLDSTIPGKIATGSCSNAMWAGEGDADTIIAARGLTQISDEGAWQPSSTT